MPSGLGLKAKRKLGEGVFDWLTGTFVWRLQQDTWVPAPDTDEFVANINASEVSVAGYTPQVVASPTINEDTAGDEAEFDCADPTFAGLAAGQTIGWSYLNLRVGVDDTTPADDPILGVHDVADTATNGGDVTLQVDAEGAWKLGGTPYS